MSGMLRCTLHTRVVSKSEKHHGVSQPQIESEGKGSLEGRKGAEVNSLSRGADCDGGGGGDDLRISSGHDLQAGIGFTGNEDGGFSAQTGSCNWERADEGDESGDRMDSEDGGEADVSG